jgi:hypothetical protein
MPIAATHPYSRETAAELAFINNQSRANDPKGKRWRYAPVCINAAKDYWAVAVYDADSELIGYL